MTVAIIQARIGSSRFRGKVLREVGGKPLLQLMVERAKAARLLEGIIIATTTRELDGPIVVLASKLGVASFRGSENDVLDRYYRAAQQFKVKAVVRLTADCPLIDPQVIDQVLQYYRDNQDRFDYPNITEDMYIDEMAVFIDAIKGKSPFPNSLEDDLRVLKLLYHMEGRL